MKTLFIGQNLITLPELDSSNDFAQKLILEYPPEGTVVRAIAQTRGRGQGLNQWQSEPGKNLTFSIILHPRFINLCHIFDLNRLVGVALVRAIKRIMPDMAISLKWPNDILIGTRKVAGILIRNTVDSRGLSHSVIGVGLNVNQLGFDPESSPNATSLLRELNVISDSPLPFNLEYVLEAVLQELEKLYLRLKSGDRESLITAYLEHLYGLNQLLNLEFEGKLHKAIILGVDEEGRLEVSSEGRRWFFRLKEVKFVFP